VDDEFQFALSRTDPSKELETYFVISNFLAKLKLIIPLQQFLHGMKKMYITALCGFIFPFSNITLSQIAAAIQFISTGSA
jgi:hypothetical protein